MLELDREDRCLNGIQTKITSDNLMVIFRFRAVTAQAGQLLCAACVVGDHHARIPGSAEVLGREKGKASVMTDGPGSSAAVLGAERLSCIFYDDQPMSVRDGHDGVHLRHLP